MREIKFRAWIPQHRKMIQVGNLVIPKGLNELGDQELCVAEKYSTIKPHHYIQPVLMQYTGLKDCKRTEEYPEGQEIYEGDIVQSNGYINREVVWADEIGGFSLEHTAEFYRSVRMEVIGNKWENPELLEAKQ